MTLQKLKCKSNEVAAALVFPLIVAIQFIWVRENWTE